LRVFYDFNHTGQGNFSNISGSGYVLNLSNNPLSIGITSEDYIISEGSGGFLSAEGGSDYITRELYYGLIENHGLILSNSTGAFFSSTGYGDFSASSVQIPNPFIDLNNCSMIFNFAPTANKEGVLFGSMSAITGSFTNQNVVGASGFNFGISSNYRPFFQHINNKGSYILSADLYLSRNNMVAITVGGGSLNIARLDYNSNKVDKQSFNIDGDSIKNGATNYLGGSPLFYGKTNGAPALSGFLQNFAAFSVALPMQTLFEIGSGMIGAQYASGAPTVYSNDVATGSINLPLYGSGVTGFEISYSSTTIDVSGTYREYGTTLTAETLNEGQTYLTRSLLPNALGDYELEILGTIVNTGTYKYAPTGDGAFDALGLQEFVKTGASYVYDISYITPDTTGLVTATLVAKTGISLEPTGYSESLLYKTVSTTGLGTVTLSLDKSSLAYHNPNYIYYIGNRV
jgi:hypothetical protein